MRKKILVGCGVLAAIMVVFLIAAALQPADFRIERSAKMAATPAEIFDQVNDFHAWDAWSPWAKLDPKMQTTFEGPPAGPGSIYKWTGNEEVGKGQMTLTESRSPELVRIKLDFIEPFAATNTTEFTFKPAGEQTEVVWSMSGHKDFISKIMCMFMSMDEMVGRDFEKGLIQMKAVVEKKETASETPADATKAATDATKVD